MANQSAAILSNGFSSLLPVTRQKLVKLCETLKQDKLTPWLWFNSRGVRVTDFYGKNICITGASYGGTAPLVFWNSIVPFLQDAIVKTLDETLETCRARKYQPEPYIRETAMLLHGYLIVQIYTYMADIDQRLRGKGYPKSVGRKDVTDEIAEMGKFLNESKDVMIQGIKVADLVIISELIKKGESQILEFKETLEYDTKENKKNGDVLFSSLKTIAGFLNAKSGTLLIGVDDSCNIKGIERDFSIMKRGNNDRLEQKIRSCLKDRFKPRPIGNVNISFHNSAEGTICRVDVHASQEIVHLDNEVYVRDGNTTQKLEGQSLTDWIEQRLAVSKIAPRGFGPLLPG